jgi:hypothetical protein
MRWFPIAGCVLLACLPAAGASSSSSHSHRKTAGRKPPAHHSIHAAASSTHTSLRLASLHAAAVPEREPQASGSASASKNKKSSRKKKTSARRAPKQMNPTPDRITDIQSALTRSGYYKGDPNGKWDADTVEALQRFQSANGLDTNGKLDALTLQKLGLGSDVAGVSAPKGIVPHSCCSMTASPSQGPPPSASTSSNSSASVASKPSPVNGADPSGSQSDQR